MPFLRKDNCNLKPVMLYTDKHITRCLLFLRLCICEPLLQTAGGFEVNLECRVGVKKMVYSKKEKRE